jgi:hypothetical protein
MRAWAKRWGPRARNVPVEVLGLVAAVTIFLAIAGTYAMQTTPFQPPDETAHLGYAHAVASFDLPTITTRVDIPDSATQWQAEQDSREDDRYRAVWVANHPPLNYVAVAPLIWLSDATDRPDGGLMFLRAVNILFAAAGIVLTYHFACEVSGGMRRIGLAAAALVALLPQGHALFSEGLNDGLGFAAGAMLLWAAARCVRTGTTRPNVAVLAVATAVAFGARAATMLMAIVVVGLVALTALVTRPGSAWQRLRHAMVVGSVAVVPAGLLFGWFYLRNVHLYGDIGASKYLLEQFQRTPRSGVWTMLRQGHRWVDLYHKLFSPSPVFSVKAPPGTNAAAAVGVIGLVLAMVSGRTGDRIAWRSRTRISRTAVSIGLAALGVVAFTVAQHISGGGNGYARYLFPALPLLATAAALGFDRILPRLGPVVAIAALGYWAWTNVPTSVDPDRVRRPRDGRRPMPDELRVTPSSAWMRDVAIVIGVIGTAALGLVLALGLIRPIVRMIRNNGATRRRGTSAHRPAALS